MILLLLILSFIKLFNHCGIIFFSFTAALLPHPPNFSETVLHRVNHLLSHLLRHSELIVLLAVFLQQKFLFLFGLPLHFFAHWVVECALRDATRWIIGGVKLYWWLNLQWSHHRLLFELITFTSLQLLQALVLVWLRYLRPIEIVDEVYWFMVFAKESLLPRSKSIVIVVEPSSTRVLCLWWPLQIIFEFFWPLSWFEQ